MRHICHQTDNGVCEKGARALSKALKVNTTLTALNLCGLTHQIQTNKEQHRQQNKTKQNNECTQQQRQTKTKTANKVKDEGTRALSKALMKNTTLSVLLLRCESKLIAHN